MKKDFMNDFGEIAELIEILRRKIVENLKTEQNYEGLLTSTQESYEACMKVDIHSFRALLDKDVETAKISLEKSKELSQTIK